MAFAKVSLNNINVKKFCEFSVGEFFRFYDNIYVKCGYDSAVCIVNNDSSDDTRKFSLDEKCEDIVVELKIF